MLRFKSETELEQWLIAQGIDLSNWGKGSAKTAQDLWNEIQSGECYLQQEPVLRVMRGVAVLTIRKNGNVLIEKKQVFADGRCRERNALPAEKMKKKETYIDAALRCVEEELHVSRVQVQILDSTHRVRQEVKDSPSYPGLKTSYTFHHIEVKSKCFLGVEFGITKEDSGGQDPICLHIWGWKKAQTVADAGEPI